jgi:hypothetical protein
MAGYETEMGRMVCGRAEDLEAEADLIFTSPPWRPAEGRWYAGLFYKLAKCLTASGSMVVVLGNDWNPPYQTTRTLETLALIQQATGLRLAQIFVAVHDEPLLSPSVAERMDGEIGRTRVPDMHTYAWWLTGPAPKVRLRGNSVIDASTGPGDWLYDDHCQTKGVKRHPAVMPIRVPEFFIELLTDRNDLVVDPFAGSNATGAAAELLNRRWLSIEPDPGHVDASRGRFPKVREHA